MSIRRSRMPKGDTGAGGAMVQLYDNTLSGATASWDVSSISQTYFHLKFVLVARSDLSAVKAYVLLRINNDSTGTYDYALVENADATTAKGETDSGNTNIRLGYIAAATAPSGAAGVVEFMLPNYAGTTFHKAGTGTSGTNSETDTATVFAYASSCFWRDTSAINRVTIYCQSSSNFVTGSRLTIYGIR
jgi:hypothetical protein